MKLLRVHVISAETCGGLLDGLDLRLRPASSDYFTFDPLCFVGPNGAGKSQFLQVLAEIFQSVLHACVGNEERIEGNPDLQFELEYLIRPAQSKKTTQVRISRQAIGKRRPILAIQRKQKDKWIDCDLTASETKALLPRKVVGYTSGDNETLSLPFLISRSGYADEVTNAALNEGKQDQTIPDTRLMLIDYGTQLEVFVANLLLDDESQRESLLKHANLHDLHSFRCVIQLAHAAAPKLPVKKEARTSRKGVQLTTELENYLENLKRCATCHTYDDKTETYIFDFWVNEQTKAAFKSFWQNTLNLYSSFHKLAMLNDLAIPKKTPGQTHYR